MAPHDAVRSFYEQHYLASQMHLCVLGKESLDELEALVARCFANLRTRESGRSAPPLPAQIAPGMIPRNVDAALESSTGVADSMPTPIDAAADAADAAADAAAAAAATTSPRRCSANPGDGRLAPSRAAGA